MTGQSKLGFFRTISFLSSSSLFSFQMKNPSNYSSSKRRASSSHRNNNASIAVWEENTMAILDSSGIKDSRDVHDDRLCFLEAVRSASLASESPSAPSRRIFDAIFQILTDCNSLELSMASYQLLIELDKHYPRVYLSKSDELESSSSVISKLVVVKEAWSPFNLASGSEEDSCYLFDPLGFSNLIDGMVHLNFDSIKPVQNSLVFQYLVNILEVDLLLRLNLYKETLNWSLLRESVMNLLLGSRKLNFKSVVRDCMSILLRRRHHSISNNAQQLRNSEDTCSQSDQDSKIAVAIAISQLEKETCVSIQRFFGLVIELDVVRKEADSLGQTSRLDGLRLPITEFIVEELTYNKDSFAPLLLVFSEPKWKLEIILLYFSKYLTKPSVRTRRSNDTPDDVTLESILSNFSTTASTKNIVKKVSSDLALLLLAHAFQACLSLIRGPRQITNSTERIGANLLEICSKLISAIKIISKVDGRPPGLMKGGKSREILPWRSGPFAWGRSGIQRGISYSLEIDLKISYDKHPCSYQLCHGAAMTKWYMQMVDTESSSKCYFRLTRQFWLLSSNLALGLLVLLVLVPTLTDRKLNLLYCAYIPFCFSNFCNDIDLMGGPMRSKI